MVYRLKLPINQNGLGKDPVFGPSGSSAQQQTRGGGDQTEVLQTTS